MGGELNPQQFTYHVDREEGRYGDDALYVTAADGDRPIGILHLDKDDAVGGGGWQYGVGLLAVGEDHRRQGVASTMYRVATNAIGYNPPHDHQITPAAAAWATRGGGAEVTKGKGSYPDWESNGTAVADGLEERQSHRVREDNKVPDDIVRVLAGPNPERPKRPRRGTPAANQPQLPLEF